MKNLLKKYLKDGNEGFSLVELIIVIAIMAILVGVVALAVIPYMEKSKESKDFATLDTVLSALNTAVAETQVAGSGDFDYTAPTTNDEKTVKNAMAAVLGSTAPTLGCTAAAGAKIWCRYDTPTNTITVLATTAKAGTAVKCKYNNQKPLEVSNK